ncbi:MAG TPA: HIT family protein [Candidatus Saccharimonadales bacterium]|nr:HIT family protein [Candidatus Saccharimonadales bacterium]
MSKQTLFDKIVAGEVPNWKIWEDDKYLAFLTPFPNTPGFTVVIPKTNPGDYVFAVDDTEILGLMKASKIIAGLLEKALKVKRVAVVFEGTGVQHLHVKLIPLHGKLGSETNVGSTHQEFHPEYIGYITTTEGPRMNDEKLDAMQEKIRKYLHEG